MHNICSRKHSKEYTTPTFCACPPQWKQGGARVPGYDAAAGMRGGGAGRRAPITPSQTALRHAYSACMLTPAGAGLDAHQSLQLRALAVC